MKVSLFALALELVHADVYLHYPPGSNNRLAEGGGNRNNNNRLMDTQNNGKGGYGYGGSAGNKAPPLSYMVGSSLSMAWTAQHSCGSENAECQMVVQYMCNDGNTPAGLPNPTEIGLNVNPIGEGPLRDGTDGNTPDPNDPDATRGLHEPTSFYKACDARNRNANLYTADQNINGNDARRTRQNPNGARSGLECPEERDYYPYWHPTPWKDLAIVTNNMALCQWYTEESQNVKGKNYCTDPQQNNAQSCGAAGWKTQQPFNIDPPMCVSAPFTRDNHLGNPAGAGNEVAVNLTIPAGAGTNAADDAQNCVLRLRYNITTGDTRGCDLPGQYTRSACVAAGGIWSAAFIDASNNNPTTENAGNGLSLPEQDPDVAMGNFLQDTGGTNSLLELAINTNQYGRTFQDRSHAFSIRSRPEALTSNARIFNLNVRGKRGNIVQAYPAVEYDFHPVDMEAGVNDFVHIQWTGNDNTNNNGNNNGEGTDNTDRHNIVQIKDTGLDVPMAAQSTDMFDTTFEWNPEPAGSTFAGSRDREELIKQFALVKQTGCLTEGQINGDQQAQNCQKLNAAAATVDLGLLKFKPGTYKYMSSRNNNFSNRAQKAQITVKDVASRAVQAPVMVTATAIENPNNRASAQVNLTWRPPGGEPYMATDFKWYEGVTEQAWKVGAYRVQASADGGENWFNAPECDGSETSCIVTGLMAGTTYKFRVRAGGDGTSWSAASAVSEDAVTQTKNSALSDSCHAQLLAQADGQYLTTGAIVGIVLGVFAGLLIIAVIVWRLRRLTPPPPPPAMGKQ